LLNNLICFGNILVKIISKNFNIGIILKHPIQRRNITKVNENEKKNTIEIPIPIINPNNKIKKDNGYV
jgi:hypothetical protein